MSSGAAELATADGFVKTREPGEALGERGLPRIERRSALQRSRVQNSCARVGALRDLCEKHVVANQETFLSMAETDHHRRRERPSALLRLSPARHVQLCEKNDLIFKEGQKGNKLCMLKDGHVDTAVLGHKGRSLKSGEAAGESAACCCEPHNVMATHLLNACKIQVLPSQAMQRLFKSDLSLCEGFRGLMTRCDLKRQLALPQASRLPPPKKKFNNAPLTNGHRLFRRNWT